jgi:hypothetical protein
MRPLFKRTDAHGNVKQILSPALHLQGVLPVKRVRYNLHCPLAYYFRK